jgi:hypothetical protein
MTTVQTTHPQRQRGTPTQAGGGALFHLLGFVGALVYFWTHAVTAGDHFWAILKALVWPAFVVYGALRILFG